MLVFLAWIALAIVSLPLAIVALVLYPIVWLLAIPFRLIGIDMTSLATASGIASGTTAFFSTTSTLEKYSTVSRTTMMAPTSSI